MDILLLLGFSLTLIFALAAAEVDDRLVMLVYIFLTSLLVGALFIYAGAIYAGVFHFIVYSGVLTVLFAATAYFVEGKQTLIEKQGNQEIIKEVVTHDV